MSKYVLTLQVNGQEDWMAQWWLDAVEMRAVGMHLPNFVQVIRKPYECTVLVDYQGHGYQVHTIIENVLADIRLTH